MKKLLLIPALMATLAAADQKKYEIAPMIGYNLSEGNIGIKNNGHFLGGLEVQFNSKDSKLSPEFSVLYSPKAKYDGLNPDPKDTAITRGAFNGVYTFDADDAFVPFAKAGFGIESVRDQIAGNDDGFFIDAGAGVKYSFSDVLALKAEAIYMAKASGIHNEKIDNNLVAMVGLSFAFGDMGQKTSEPVKQKEAVVAAAPVVDGDDDHDGVKNSVDECLNTPEGVKVGANGCALDSDNDGVLDSEDKCPNTELGTAVDADGCALDSDNDGVVDNHDQCPNTKAGVAVDEEGCALDSDNDGVVDADDQCPNTPAGTVVNDNGCVKTINLSIHFENNSAKIKQESQQKLDKYAEFLKTYPNFSSVITGYTDDRGAAEYNKKLSLKRAQAVVDALIERGVDPSQLEAKGMGEANPIADNATAEGRAKNRRIEATLIRH